MHGQEASIPASTPHIYIEDDLEPDLLELAMEDVYEYCHSHDLDLNFTYPARNDLGFNEGRKSCRDAKLLTIRITKDRHKAREAMKRAEQETKSTDGSEPRPPVRPDFSKGPLDLGP